MAVAAQIFIYIYIYITKFVDKVSKQMFVCSTLCQTYTFGNNLQEEVGDPSVLHCIFRNLLHAYGILQKVNS
jgi:hypothetical protein